MSFRYKLRGMSIPEQKELGLEEIIVFVHRDGVEAPVEIKIADTATAGDLLAHPAIGPFLVAIEIDVREVCVFVEEEAVPLPRHVPLAHRGGRHGSRIHLSHSHEVEVEVHFVGSTGSHRFAPGVRVRRVKEWAVQHFGLPGSDAIEHVLNLHGTSDMPSPGTPLSALLHGHSCRVVFDLVPAKRVEG